MRAVAYLRVSSSSQVDGHSLDAVYIDMKGVKSAVSVKAKPIFQTVLECLRDSVATPLNPHLSIEICPVPQVTYSRVNLT